MFPRRFAKFEFRNGQLDHDNNHLHCLHLTKTITPIHSVIFDRCWKIIIQNGCCSQESRREHMITADCLIKKFVLSPRPRTMPDHKLSSDRSRRPTGTATHFPAPRAIQHPVVQHFSFSGHPRRRLVIVRWCGARAAAGATTMGVLVVVWSSSADFSEAGCCSRSTNRGMINIVLPVIFLFIFSARRRQEHDNRAGKIVDDWPLAAGDELQRTGRIVQLHRMQRSRRRWIRRCMIGAKANRGGDMITVVGRTEDDVERVVIRCFDGIVGTFKRCFVGYFPRGEVV